MAKFVTIGYGDQAGYDRTDPAVRDKAHTYDAGLYERGIDMGIAGRPALALAGNRPVSRDDSSVLGGRAFIDLSRLGQY